MSEIGSYAVWLEASPPLDPVLLRFDPPAWHMTDSPDAAKIGSDAPESHMNMIEVVAPPTPEPSLWRSCSLIRYLRLAVLEGGGFPGAVGVPEFEKLRAELTHRLLAF